MGVGYQNSETPEPIVTKFVTGDYVGDTTKQAKIQPIAQWWRLGKWVKYHSRVVFSERELTFTFAICYRRSVCLSVCNVRAPYSAG